MTFQIGGFVDNVGSRKLNVLSVRVLQNGQLLGLWDRDGDARRLQHSVSKSFTCMAVGLAIAEGKLTLDARLNDFFPNYGKSVKGSAYPPGELTLGHLLRMASGHDAPPLWAEERETLQEKDWAKYYMSLPLDRMPGETFTYSSGDTFMISAMVQAAALETVRDYLVPRLFEPLGIRDVRWDASPLGVTLGCTGLWISCEELSRFGQMLLQKGRWQGVQLIPEAWISEVTRKQIDTPGTADWGAGYGGQFWMCTHGAYRADGMRGQFCVVIPDKEAVIAINSDEDDMQGILDAVWADILPQL
ncbi:beta-lactamase family protein [Paenibacillus cellulositrophicus]|uniref:serine hydrolase domain-containing protein n=1 Tax=Paenibacillus cellulositrophicus TaxID=562959 RepID=UPI00203B5C0D|nr:serine hydrolase [Paenibacillus cellulositrophicus]MCM3001912.1 beta-lactamase family protein [Paenibacillus cellulositrophicus]